MLHVFWTILYEIHDIVQLHFKVFKLSCASYISHHVKQEWIENLVTDWCVHFVMFYAVSNAKCCPFVRHKIPCIKLLISALQLCVFVNFHELFGNLNLSKADFNF